MPLTAPPCLMVASADDAIRDGIIRRLDGGSRVQMVSSLSDLARQMHPSDLGPDDVLVVDLRRASHEEHSLADAWERDAQRRCRLALLVAASDLAGATRHPTRIVVAEHEPVVDFISAVAHGDGHHDVLIATMRALMPRLSPIGQRAVVEVLSRRFDVQNVNGLAHVMGLHRSRLHHMLLAAGDPTPKRLFDECVTLVAALLVRGTDMPQASIARFVRARHSRAPREAVRRQTGMTFAQLRMQLRAIDHDAIVRLVLDVPSRAAIVAA